MITDFRTWTSYLGNDDSAEYSFDFKITDPKQIVVVCLDVSSDPTTIDWIERGDVGLNIQEVEYDSVLGGGSVIFADNLAAGKRIYIKLADDAPTQPTQFREQQDFKLRSIENALDFIVNQMTRQTDKSQRSLKFADHYSHVEETVNLEMPEFPMAHGMPIMDSEGSQLNMKAILTILDEQGVLQLIQDAQDGADSANARLDLLEPRVDTLETTVGGFAGDISALESRMDTAEAEIDVLQAESLDYENRITALENATPAEFFEGSDTMSIAATLTVDASVKRAHYTLVSDGGAITLSENEQVGLAGVSDGYILALQGGNDVDVITFAQSAIMDLNGNCALTSTQVLTLMKLSTKWVELSRRQ